MYGNDSEETLRWPVFLVPAAVAEPASPAKLGEARLTLTRQSSKKRTPWTGVTCMSGSIPTRILARMMGKQMKNYVARQKPMGYSLELVLGSSFSVRIQEFNR